MFGLADPAFQTLIVQNAKDRGWPTKLGQTMIGGFVPAQNVADILTGYGKNNGTIPSKPRELAC